jgi:hypothetical protein
MLRLRTRRNSGGIHASEAGRSRWRHVYCDKRLHITEQSRGRQSVEGDDMNDDMRRGSPLDPDWESVPTGTPVYTVDNKKLGTVQSKREDGLYIRGDSAMGSDYIVTAPDIGHIDQGGVHLIVTAAQALRAHYQGTSQSDTSAPGGMAPGSMQRENPPPS